MILKGQKENFTALVLQNEFFSVEKCMYFPLGFYYFDGSSCLVYIYIYIYMCVCIYIYIHTYSIIGKKHTKYTLQRLMKKASIYIYQSLSLSLYIYILDLHLFQNSIWGIGVECVHDLGFSCQLGDFLRNSKAFHVRKGFTLFFKS